MSKLFRLKIVSLTWGITMRLGIHLFLLVIFSARKNKWVQCIFKHSRQYSKLRKSVRVTQSQNVPLSCLSRPLADRLAEAAYRDILGLSYARAFPQLGVLPAVWTLTHMCVFGLGQDLLFLKDWNVQKIMIIIYAITKISHWS